MQHRGTNRSTLGSNTGSASPLLIHPYGHFAKGKEAYIARHLLLDTLPRKILLLTPFGSMRQVLTHPLPPAVTPYGALPVVPHSFCAACFRVLLTIGTTADASCLPIPLTTSWYNLRGWLTSPWPTLLDEFTGNGRRPTECEGNGMKWKELQ